MKNRHISGVDLKAGLVHQKQRDRMVVDRAVKRAEGKRRKFRCTTSDKQILAMEPSMVDFSYLYTGQVPNTRTNDGIAIVTINGPLEHHCTFWWDSYEAIIERVKDAMTGEDIQKIHFEQNFWRNPDKYEPVNTQPARAVILRIDSPGGEAAGTMWAHRKLRALREEYNCPIYAYADEMACSAAYAIASAADEIWTSDTGNIGSIGVIATLFDRTKQNAAMGLNIELLTSGEYKADNHADRVIDDGVRSRMQAKVDTLAEIFWKVVAKARSRALDEDISPEMIADLQAGVFVGKEAVDNLIADGVAGWDRFLQHVSDSLAEFPSMVSADGVSAA